MADGWRVAKNTDIMLHQADGAPRSRWMAHSDQISGLAWSPDSKWLASGSRDRTVRLWKADGEAGPVLAGQQMEIRRLAWSKDGRLATMSTTGTVTVWGQVAQGLEPLWIGLMVGDHALAFDAKGLLRHGDLAVFEKEFIYILETKDGGVELVHASELINRPDLAFLNPFPSN